jgi:hypothetical protein
MHLLMSFLIANFGHGASRPRLTAITRLTFLLLGSLGLSWTSLRAVQSMPINRTTFGIFVVWFALQCLVVFVNLGSVAMVSKTTTTSLLWTLPIRPVHRRLLCCLNHFVYTSLTLIIAVPAFTVFLQNTEIPVPYGYLALIAASLGGCGIFYVAATVRFGLIFALLTLCGEYLILQQIIADPQQAVWKLAFIGCGVTCLLGIMHYRTFADQSLLHMGNITRSYARRLDNRFWFIKKMARSPLAKNLTITAAFASILAAYAHRVQLFDSGLLSSFACLLGAASAADIRSLCRARKPAEITALRGTVHFVSKEYLGSISVCLAISPLILLAIMHAQSFYDVLFVLISSLSGVSLGIFIGSLITPYPGDISAQASSVICSSTLLLLIQKYLPTVASYSLLLFISIMGSFIVEFIRNPYSWRYRYVFKKSNATD